MNIIDLRDIVALEDSADEDEQATYTLWKDALQEDCGIDIHDMAENEPTLILDGDFEQYAEELAEDLGLVDKDLHWPYTCIDWERAASDLQQDYSSVDVGGETYWYRQW